MIGSLKCINLILNKENNLKIILLPTMKKFLVISILLVACNSQSKKETSVINVKDSVSVVAPAKKFEGVNFASTKDLNAECHFLQELKILRIIKEKFTVFAQKNVKMIF